MEVIVIGVMVILFVVLPVVVFLSRPQQRDFFVSAPKTESESSKPSDMPEDSPSSSQTYKGVQQGQPAPGWMLPAGITALALGVLAFGLGAAKGGAEARPGYPPGQKLLIGLLDGGTNPLFFVGVPLGCYWLYRSARGPARRASPSEEENPKLTHCPDCGKHVSRLATSCPHCGRPLKDDQ